jgi:hypothetical protein
MKCKVCKEEINLTVLEYQTIHVGVVYKMNKRKKLWIQILNYQMKLLI